MTGSFEKRGHGRGGFTMVELVIALGVLAFGLLALAALQIQALRDGSAGQHVSDAGRLARAQMEQIQRMPFATVSAAADTGWNAPPWINFAGLAPGQIPVQLQVPAGAPLAPQIYNLAWRVTSTADPDLLDVDVEVSWAEASRPNAKPTRTGLPTVTFSSTRYDW